MRRVLARVAEWSRRRSAGLGMTEYIIIVGLIGLALTAVVVVYKSQLEVTLVGGEKPGMMGTVDGRVTNDIRTAGEDTAAEETGEVHTDTPGSDITRPLPSDDR